MSEIPVVNYDNAELKEFDLEKLHPFEGKIILTEGRPPSDAVYFKDADDKIIAYLTFTPYWGSKEKVVIESFTNETYRQKGLQEKLNAYLVRLLRNRGFKKIIGHIMMDNSRSFLNRLKMKDPDSQSILKAEIPDLDRIDLSRPIDPTYLDVVIDLNEAVESNEDLIQRVTDLQKHLTQFRMGPSISEIIRQSRS